MSSFQRVPHTKRTLSLLLAGTSAFCLNSQTLKLSVIRGLPRYEVPWTSIQNVSPCHVFPVRLLVTSLCPVEILHTGPSARSPAASLGKCGPSTL